MLYFLNKKLDFILMFVFPLGDGYRQVRVGQLSTQLGALSLSVAYRTKLTISPQHSGKDNAIMLKSDHFRPERTDFSPKRFPR